MKKVTLTYIVCILAWGVLIIPTGLKIGYIIPIAFTVGVITASMLLVFVSLLKMAAKNDEVDEINKHK